MSHTVTFYVGLKLHAVYALDIWQATLSRTQKGRLPCGSLVDFFGLSNALFFLIFFSFLYFGYFF
ncbi:MAG: hypothetical protein FWH17_11470, partial [Oscillospiraceae bacterium]|nr:hypothetical protein [Oscillospiraceae bacterium]